MSRLVTRLELALGAILIGAAVAPAGAQAPSPFTHSERQQDDAAAMNRMGIRYAQGDGVPQD